VIESQTRGLLAMAVALLVVMGLLFAQGPESARVDPEASVPVWSLAASSIERVRITRPDDELLLARDGHGWKVLEPREQGADPDLVASLVSSLSTIERGVPVDDPESLEAYGLGATPEAVVEVTTTAGLVHELVVGLPTPVGYRTYARRPDGPVLAVTGGLHPLVTEPVERYRDHRVFGFEPQRVRRVVIRSPQGVLDLRGEATTWFLEGYGRADADKVDDVVVGLLDLRFDTYLDTDQVVGQGVYEVEVFHDDDDVFVLRLGDQTPMGVVASTADGRFGTIYPEAVKQLDRGPRSVLDPFAFPLDLDRADEVTVQWEGRRFHAVRNGMVWEADGLGEAEAWASVDALSSVAATHRHELPEGDGRGEGQVSIRVDGGLRVVWLGEREGEFVIARDAAGGPAYRVVAADLDAFAQRVW
jgi:hypothetical protein